ncbi:MAG: diguanylate cyclase [Nitrospinae bacterium]|nr:diguanylate cyclase [Nitrospinota bacterium]
MKLGISKKLIGAHGVGLVLFLILAIFSYISLNLYSSIQKRTDELARRIEYISDLQILIQRLLMPPNDYLITGDIKERENFAHLVTDTSSALTNIKIGEGKTDEELTFEKEVEKGFIELQQKAMVLLSTENPVGNREAARLMEEMDAFADGLTNLIENFHIIAKGEMEIHNIEASKIDNRILKIYILLFSVSLFGIILTVLLITKGVVRPLLELTDAAKVIGQGNLDNKIKIETGDEIEGLGMEFNNMAQSLKEKITEVREYSEKLEKTNRQLDQNILQLYTLYNISKTLTATLEMEKVLNQVVEEVSRALKLHKINIMLMNADRTDIYTVTGTGISEKAMKTRFRLGEGIYGWIAMTGQAEIINDLSKNPHFKPTDGLDDNVSSLICAPFKGRGQVIGVLNAYRLGGKVFDIVSFELLLAAANQIGMALENARLFEETRALAITDGMTSLYNYRYFTAYLNEEFEKVKRYKRPLSLIMIDIDFFKKYNDAYGHPAGDELLRNIAGVLKNTVRKSDTVARYGGEEFVVVLPETEGEMALITAEKLRKAVEENEFNGRKVTISLGVASYTEELKLADDLVKLADNALYRSKEEGRNKVCAL